MKYTFKIPALPESINSLYRINYAHHVIYLSQEGRAFKQIAKSYMPPMKFPKGAKFRIVMTFCRNWHYKNKKNRRADIQNLIKILIDAIFEHIGVDDSYVYQLAAIKKHDPKLNGNKHTVVTLESL